MTNDSLAQHKRPERKIMLVAAEASGDVLGAGLIRELKQQSPQPLSYFGVGGPRMADEGIRSPFDISDLSILGMIEGLKAYSRVKKRVAETVALAVETQPDAVVLIDSWGFTLRVAKGIRAALPHVPLIKYVGPQVWATRPGRAKTLAETVDLLLALSPMDPPYFEAEGLRTIVVGNPALHVDFSQADPTALRAKLGVAEQPILLVLPGSRPAEIRRLAPVFRETLLRLKSERPDLTIVLPVAETVRDLVKDSFSDLPLHFVEGEADKKSAMKAATVALACSGTVSTELALAGCPMVIAYKVEPLTWLIFKHVSTLNHVTLFNIVAQKEIAPEYIQPTCTPTNLYKAIVDRLDDIQLRNNQISEQFKALDLMGRGGEPPAIKAAAAVLDILG